MVLSITPTTKNMGTKIKRFDPVKTLTSIPVSNNYEILKWMSQNITNRIQNDGTTLTAVLSDKLNTLFGNPNKNLKLSYMTKLWVLKYDDLVFNVFTSKRGTSIELCDHTSLQIRSGEKQEEIINFLTELDNLINSI